MLALSIGLIASIGFAQASMEALMINEADIDTFPHAAYLTIECDTSSSTNSYACGASIVNQNILLTAAHCFEKCLDTSEISATVGSESEIDKKSYSVSKFRMHENFDPALSINDIALAKLHTSLVFGPAIKRVLLLEDPPYDDVAAVTAWAFVNESIEDGAVQLKKEEQLIWHRKECQAMLNWVPPNTFCGKVNKKSNAVAGHSRQGDSGSALMVRGYIQIGLVSFKNEQAAMDIIVYTDVPYFLDWIRVNTKILMCDVPYVDQTKMM